MRPLNPQGMTNKMQRRSEWHNSLSTDRTRLSGHGLTGLSDSQKWLVSEAVARGWTLTAHTGKPERE
eukprot:1935703-Amphidinium_carterae.1